MRKETLLFFLFIFSFSICYAADQMNYYRPDNSYVAPNQQPNSDIITRDSYGYDNTNLRTDQDGRSYYPGTTSGGYTSQVLPPQDIYKRPDGYDALSDSDYESSPNGDGHSAFSNHHFTGSLIVLFLFILIIFFMILR